MDSRFESYLTHKNKFGSLIISCIFVIQKPNYMIQKIKQHLLLNPSYFKWSNGRLAEKFGCAERTISSIVKELSDNKQSYLRSLKM